MVPDPSSFFRTLFRRRPRAIKPRAINPRDLRAQDPKKPSLANLNRDIIILVIHHLHNVDPKSTNSLVLVCSALYSMARYIQHQEVLIDITEDNTAERLHFIARDSLLPAIRTLHVHVSDRVEKLLDNLIRVPNSRRDPERLNAKLAAWKQLGNLIPMMPGLRDLHWASALILDPVLEHLRKNPQIHLHLSIRNWSYSEDACPGLKQLPAILAGTRNLSSLRIKLVYPSAEFCRAITQVPLKQLLLSSPGLRALSLHIAHPDSGCVVFGPGVDYCGFGLSNGESLPPLEELEVTGYPWGQQLPVSGWGFNWRGYPEPTGTEMEYWARNLDWSQLRRLRLGNSSIPLAVHLAPQLTALEEIEFSDPNYNDTSIPTFFNNIIPSTLTSISTPYLPPNCISTITAHAAKLHTLSIHKSPLTNQDLALLRDGLPSLDTLTVVSTRDAGTWPYDTLSILAGFPRLLSLTIMFDIGLPAAPHEPYLTISSTGWLFTHLRQHGASRLRRLHAHSGFPPRPIQGFAIGPFWHDDNTTSFICQVADDKPEVWCPELSRMRNEQLRRVARGEAMTEEERNIIKHIIKFPVALTGPMKMAEWSNWQREWGIGF